MTSSTRRRERRILAAASAAGAAGLWIQGTALSWLLYRLSGEPAQLGLLVVLAHLPAVLLGPAAGRLLDRLGKRRLLAFARLCWILQSAVLALLAFTGAARPWNLLALAALHGLALAVDFPGQQALAGELAAPGKRAGYLSLKWALDNVPRVLGPAAAGLLIVRWGEWPCFLLAGLGHLAFLAGLRALPEGTQPAADAAPGPEAPLRSSPEARAALGLLAVLQAATVPLFALAPVFARDVLGAGAREAGWLAAAAGLGTVAGSLCLARRRDEIEAFGGLAARAALGASLALGLAASARSLPALLFLYACVGAAAAVQGLAVNALLQERAHGSRRGAAMGVYSSVLLGASSLGALLGTGAASRLGAPAAAALAAAVCALAAVVEMFGAPRFLWKTRSPLGPHGA